MKEVMEQFEQIKVGIEMTSTVMDGVFKNFKLVQFDPLGEKFDPNLHEAVF